MRANNRRANGCDARGGLRVKAKRLATTMEATACDGVLGGWLSQCLRGNATLASMTWTKGHWWLQSAGLHGFVLPDDSSVAVHGLKQTYGEGVWRTTHNLTATSEVTRFPPLLWRYEPHASWIERGMQRNAAATMVTGAVYTARNPAVHAWYMRTCATKPTPRATTTKDAGPRRSQVLPHTWRWYGCHRSRNQSSPRYRGLS